jgi:hypothetical protein
MVTYSSNDAWTTKMGFVAGTGWRRVKILQTWIQGWERKWLQIGCVPSPATMMAMPSKLAQHLAMVFGQACLHSSRGRYSSWGCNEKREEEKK